MMPTLSRVVSLYLSSALALLVVAAASAVGATWLAKQLGARRALTVLRSAVCGALLLAFGVAFTRASSHTSFAPAVVSLITTRDDVSVERQANASVSSARPVVALPVRESLLFFALAVVLVLAAVGKPVAAWRRLYRVVHALPVERRVRSLRIVLSRHHGTFAVGFWRSRTVCVAPGVWADRQRRRWVLAHELAHLRHHDSLWTFGGFVLRAVYAPFPWVGWLLRSHAALCEFAADEAAITRQHLSPDRYASYLLEQAEQSLTPAPALATAFGTSLEKRVRLLLRGDAVARPRLAAACCTVLLVAVTGVAHATARLVATPTLSQSDVERLVAQTPCDFPLEATPEVVERLNTTLGSAEARERWRRTLARLPEYSTHFVFQLENAQMPRDLVVLAMFESGLDAQIESSGHARGLWQFIASTARRYGLRVDDQVDERIDVTKATPAAMRLLADLHAEFGDWLLAFKAYNEGAARVRQLIEENGTRDAWTIERASSSEHYVPGLLAAMILVKHPELLNAP